MNPDLIKGVDTVTGTLYTFSLVMVVNLYDVLILDLCYSFGI